MSTEELEQSVVAVIGEDYPQILEFVEDLQVFFDDGEC